MKKASVAFAVVGLAALLVTLGASPIAWTEQGTQSPKPLGPTPISSTPWDPADLQNAKVIYGDDDRLDVYLATSAQQQLALSVCGLLDWNQLTDNGNGTYTISTSAYEVYGYPACPDEPFGDQPTAAWCTGFLVGDDLIATAGHCYDSSDLATVRFVFGFVMQDATTPVTTVNADQVYQGVAVVGHMLTSEYDFSVVRVDRSVTAPGALPLDIRRTGTVANDTQIGVIGHPSGLPMKVAFGDQTVVMNNSPAGYFVANLDTYGGNSGSPVFDAATGLVEGILVRGEADFIIQKTCFVSNELLDSQGAEEVSKATTFAQYVPEPHPSCPTLYYWNGKDYIRWNFILGGAIPRENEREDYAMIKGPQVRPLDGKYWFQIRETEPETSYIDLAKLMMVKPLDVLANPAGESDSELCPSEAESPVPAQLPKGIELKLLSAEHSTKGDVRFLLKGSDNAYVRMDTGDTITLSFQCPSKAPSTANFVFAAEGFYEALSPKLP